MSLYKRIYSVIISLAVLSVTIYYLGCASAESTTGKLAFQQKDFQKAEIELKKGLLFQVISLRILMLTGLKNIIRELKNLKMELMPKAEKILLEQKLIMGMH